MFTHSYSKAINERAMTEYDALLNSSFLRWLQKEDADEDKSRTATDREFQAARPQTAKVAKLRDP